MQGGDPHGRYADMFNDFFKNPRMASTYKPVFLGALVDIATGKAGGPPDTGGWLSKEDGGRIRVDLNLVAVPFAKFYWDMVAVFDPRHTPLRMADDKDHRRDVVNIVKLISDEMTRMKKDTVRREMAANGGPAGAAKSARDPGGGPPASDAPPTLEQLASDRMAGFRREVIEKSIKPEVLRNLAKGMPGLYESRGGRNSIVLDAEAVAYMRRNAFTLKAALGELIDRHLEGTNPAARHIATMVNLNESYGGKFKKVRKLESRAMPPRDDIDPLFRISLDLTAGLARLSKDKGRFQAGGTAGAGPGAP